MNEEYCCWAEKRLLLSDNDKTIQGYSGGVFWERNTLNLQMKENKNTVRKAAFEEGFELISEAL
jgi:site-specific DNA-methyltransferase (adenine-specific)